MYLFIHFISLYVSSIKCSSSGCRIVLIHHLVWLVCVSECLVCRSLLTGITNSHLPQTNHTWWCMNTIRSPDDEHLMLLACREMKLINKYTKKCIRLVINKNLWRDARSTRYKKYVLTFRMVLVPSSSGHICTDTDESEEPTASIFKVERHRYNRFGETCSSQFSTLTLEATCSSKNLVNHLPDYTVLLRGR